MPKMKTHSGAKKRFRKTAIGQDPGAPRVHVAQPGQEARQAQAAPGPAGRDRRRRPRRGEEAAGRREGRAMTRVKRSVHARKKRRTVLERAKGYRGEKHSSYRRAKEQVMKSDAYAYRDRRARKRDFRSLWIVRINAAARQEGLTYSRLMAGLQRGRGRRQPQDARGRRRARPRDLPAICRASQAGPGGVRGRILIHSGRRQTPGRRPAGQPPFLFSDAR